jgi:hypothetical protein
LALFGPSRGEKGQKKVNRQTPDKNNYPKKKLTNAGYFAENKSWLYDNYSQSYIRLLLPVFFVATRYFLPQFYDSKSPPGLPNKKCDPKIDSHPADNAFLMFFSLSK